MSVLGGFISILNVFSLPAFMPVMFVGRVAIEDDELDKPHEFEVTVNAPSGDRSSVRREQPYLHLKSSIRTLSSMSG